MSTDTQRSISTSVWSDPWFEKQNPDVKLLWMYLLTHPKSNMLGIFEITLTRAAFETSIPLERVTKGFETLAKDFKAVLASDFVWIVNFWSHQKYNDNMRTSARRVFDETPENVRLEFAVMGSELSPNPWETLCNGLGIPFGKLEIGNRKEEIINPSTPTRAHVRAGEAFRPPVDEPSVPEPVAVPPAQLYDQAPKPPTLEQVIEYANMRGFAPDIAEWYYNLRAADAWTKESKQGNMRHILDWRHDFLLLAEKRRYELDQRKAGERTAERVTTTSRPFVIKGTGPAASDSSKAAS